MSEIDLNNLPAVQISEGNYRIESVARGTSSTVIAKGPKQPLLVVLQGGGKFGGWQAQEQGPNKYSFDNLGFEIDAFATNNPPEQNIITGDLDQGFELARDPRSPPGTDFYWIRIPGTNRAWELGPPIPGPEFTETVIVREFNSSTSQLWIFNKLLQE